MEPFRLRLKFDDSVLSDSQKSDGLQRSWVLVEPGHHSISDLVSYLLHAFDLWDSCPHGIFLSVEGFALPHFESIAILDNNDLVCVKRKGSKLLVGEKVKKKLPCVMGMPLSANEDFGKEAGDYQSETEEEDEWDVQTDSLDEDNVPNGEASIKKRKASKQLKNSKKKRKCKKYDSSSSQKEHSDGYLQNGYCQKKSSKSKQDEVHNAVCSNIENWEGTVSLSSEPGGTVKVSVSRSTRRKKTQRQRWRMAEQLHKKKSLGEDLDHLKISNPDSESGDEVVPVVVRPGHIRFTAPGKEKDIQQHQGAEGSCNWHGGTNNKKGKKWGKEKQNANTWGGNTSTGEWKSGSKPNDYKARGRSWAARKAPPRDASKDYEKLVPLTDFPLEGDTLAYRLLDMSSSFCPVLTSYRVGKVSSSDPKSNRVVLVPVPEYPFEFKKASDHTSGELAAASRYKDDGTLEIDFPLLADVRIVSRGWNPTSGSGWWTDNRVGPKWAETSTWAPASGWGSSSESGWGTQAQPGNEIGMNAALASTSENGNKDVWEEMSAAVSAKKAELLKEDTWNKKRKPANYTWSYRTPRNRALGPI